MEKRSAHAATRLLASARAIFNIDVRDVAAALLLLAHDGERGGAYNLASGRETPIGSILSELLRIRV